MANSHPARIVCLSAEAVEILYRIGCGDRVVGATGFAVEPPEARQKPRVSGFSEVNYEKVDALRPDLIITFSDIQAEATKELIRRGHAVLATNQRSLEDIFNTIILIGRVAGCEGEAVKLVDEMRGEIFRIEHREGEAKWPTVYFEEWDEPMISGIKWVSELIEAAGGNDIFPEMRKIPRAPDRVVSGEEVIKRSPEIIIASWCGKKTDLKSICTRPGWQDIPAVIDGEVHEMHSNDILQPGPGLLRGFKQLRRIIERGMERTNPPGF